MNVVSPGTAASTQDKIQEMVRRLVERFQPEKIILFGSHARGTPHRDSDVDLLVIANIPGSKRDARVKMRLALSGIGVAKDIVLATPDEIRRYGDAIGTILRPALREGKVLYERK